MHEFMLVSLSLSAETAEWHRDVVHSHTSLKLIICLSHFRATMCDADDCMQSREIRLRFNQFACPCLMLFAECVPEARTHSTLSRLCRMLLSHDTISGKHMFTCFFITL